MWVARDKNGDLKLFYNKPFRLYEDNFKFGDDKWVTTWINWMQIDPNLFPELTWDDEPIEVEIIRKN